MGDWFALTFVQRHAGRSLLVRPGTTNLVPK